MSVTIVTMWLQIVGLIAFAVLLATGFYSLRRGEVIGSRRVFVGILAVGVVVLVVAAVAVVVTAG